MRFSGGWPFWIGVLVVLIFYLNFEVINALKAKSTRQKLNRVKNRTKNKHNSKIGQNETLSPPKDGIFESSGILDVEFGSGLGDSSGSGAENEEAAEIRLNGKRLHSISEAITKLLNNGRERLENLKKGKYYTTPKTTGPVVRAYVSDSSYENPKLYRKSSFFHHHRRPYHLRHRLHLLRQEPFDIPDTYPMDGEDLGYDEDKEPSYRKPVYLYYPETMRYDNAMSSPYSTYAENVEQNLLSNYALQQQLAGKS